MSGQHGSAAPTESQPATPRSEQEAPPAKIARAGGDDNNEIRAYVDRTRSELFGALDGVKRSLSGITENLDKHFYGLSQQLEQRFSRVEARVDNHQKSITDMQAEIAEMRLLLNCVKTETPTTTTPVSQAFHRTTNPSIIVVRAQALVSSAKVAECIGPWLADCNLDVDDWEVSTLEGPAARRFTVTIRGAAGYAARKVAQCLGNLRNHDNTYRRFNTVDVAGQQIQLFVSSDKNTFQIKRELFIKQARKLLSEKYEHKRFFTDRGKGEISCQWRPILRITPVDGEAPTIEWDRTVCSELGIDNDGIGMQLKTLFCGPEETHGSSEDLQDFLHFSNHNFEAVFSGFDSRRKGGVATLLPSPCSSFGFGASSSVTGRALVVGRALYTCVKLGSRSCGCSEIFTIHHFNIHNFKLSSEEVRLIVSYIDSSLELVRCHPHSHFVVVAGDFNFSSEPPRPTIPPPNFALAPVVQEWFASRDSGWRSTLGAMIEIDTPDMTHYNGTFDHASKIDRIFVSGPSWRLTQMSITAATIETP
ncbi:unnamed protein product, partial [Prorocentrum cordatum]